MTTIAFLGLGHMGGPMSANLVAAGHFVRGFDPMPTAAAAATKNGVAVFDGGPDAVADADVVITMLPNGDVVKRCYAEVLPAAQQGALFIDSSTISVNDAARCTRWLNRGVSPNSTHRSPAGCAAPSPGRWRSWSAVTNPRCSGHGQC
ncbi:NAD binding domain of 6-phosphogluconate dehydrogenase family protein [Mycobacterium xenopi 4042]|uniref:NAD binding domain of 6-phosphogluconate dehydrogenase family protein n=1 Tax=Mycobacterium xenopi 4042 TaxID=1299334 RepID=X7YL42_MYCXE|nr:NAD binding domain of 6-phosphogluconate dehydrogenase family protein [Mycobacterium xenopi 4042]